MHSVLLADPSAIREALLRVLWPCRCPILLQSQIRVRSELECGAALEEYLVVAVEMFAVCAATEVEGAPERNTKPEAVETD